MDLLPLDHPRLKKNNFDLLRLLLALIVCLVHAYKLSGFEALRSMTEFLSSRVAVQAFFVVSGFLIVMSYERSSSLVSYTSKRIRRIYPAYAVVIMLAALGLVLVSNQSVSEYFSQSWLKYMLANLAFLNFLQPTLPGVFEANRVPEVNGALWTLKVEVMFYCFVPLLVSFLRRVPRLPFLLLVYVLSVGYSTFLIEAAARTGNPFYEQLSRQLPGQLCFFIAGAALFYYLPLFERRVKLFVTLAAVVLVADTWTPLPWLQPAALAVIVLFFGLFLYAGNFGKFGDFSYGVYILHFPLIQLLLNAGWSASHPWAFLVTAVSLTFVGAIVMWNLVEKRFLLRSSHYVSSMETSQQASPTSQPVRT